MTPRIVKDIEADVRKMQECGEDAVVVVDDPAKLPPELQRTLDGRTRRWFMRNWPPQELLPDAEPAFVKSWLYTMGVATLVAMILCIGTGIILAIFGPEWWTTTSTGLFVDGLHYWSVQAFFLFMAAHFISVFLMGAFRGRRWATWMLGVVAFLTAVVTAFTGYASLQDWEAQWVVTQGKDAVNSLGLGGFVNLLNAGQLLTIHVILFPAILLFIVLIHILWVRKHGIAPPYDAVDSHLEMVEEPK
jgi:quinol-cytochrome oxidoreductase complex cytochrome b subunit